MKPRIVQLGLALCALAASLPLDAAQRTFVSTGGVNNPACSLLAPCRDFATAISATSAGGEVIVLDSGGYGPVTITQSVSIIAPDGVYAGVTVYSGNGVTIGTAGVVVALKGLTINGLGGANGILMTDGTSLRIENCTVTGFTAFSNAGINISAAAAVLISNTVVANNYVGIVLDGGADADISGVKVVNNLLHGLLMAGTSNATTVAVVSNSIASGQGFVGFFVLGQNVSTGGFGPCASCTRKMTLINSEASNNNYGTDASGSGALMNVSNSVGTNNRFCGFGQSSGSIFRSGQNNVLTDNASAPTCGTITPGGFFY